MPTNAFKARCPHCQTVFEAPSHFKGKRGKCPKCGEIFVVNPVSAYGESTTQSETSSDGNSAPTPESGLYDVEDSSKLCPFCGENIPKEANLCGYCGEVLTPKNGGGNTLSSYEHSPRNSSTSQRQYSRNSTQFEGFTFPSFGNFLAFRWLITPGIFGSIWFIGSLAITVVALTMLFGLSPDIPYQKGLAILLFLAGNVLWRIVCEVAIVPFKVFEALVSIDNELKK